MDPSIQIIKNRNTILQVRKKGRFIKGKNFNMHFLEDNNLNQIVFVGYIATKKLGNAVRRNKAKRLLRELARKILIKYCKINYYYVLIAKNSIFDTSFSILENELKELINDI